VTKMNARAALRTGIGAAMLAPLIEPGDGYELQGRFVWRLA
jgi:hypothetical protein